MSRCTLQTQDSGLTTQDSVKYNKRVIPSLARRCVHLTPQTIHVQILHNEAYPSDHS